ncbi:bud site selection protein 22 [[Candida] anglica]
MKQSNDMWKLDLLEAKFTSAHPRFPHTKKLLHAKNNSKLLKKLPSTRAEAEQLIAALKQDYFGRKYYGAHKKLEKEVLRIIKSKENETEVKDFVSNEENIQNMLTSKLVKSVITSILTTKELKETPPKFISEEVRTIIKDKNNKAHPSRFFIDTCQNNKTLNKYISNLWNNKTVKPLLGEIEWSFKVVRGNLSKQEKDLRKSQTGKDVDEEENENAPGSDDDSDDDSDDEAIEQDVEMTEEDLDRFAIYENSDPEAEGDAQFAIDPNVNYNEVTDEEASADEESDDDESEDDFFEENEKKTSKKEKKESKKLALPDLASGYFSGGDSDSDDVDNDEVVKAAVTQRKNRRGQRARQKLWEKKYGKEAKHVKQEQIRYASEREQRQKDYEERCRKREEKARLAVENAPSGSNVAPLGERKPRTSDSTSTASPAPQAIPEKKEHPSWEAKRLAEEKLKNVKFTGKKITFD